MKQQDARTDSISVFDDLPAEENLPSFSLYTYKHTYIFETSVFFVRFGCFFFFFFFVLFVQTNETTNLRLFQCASILFKRK